MIAIDPSAGVWGLFLSAFISATLMPGGSEALLAYLVAQSEIPAVLLLVAATTGNTLGALTTWLLGIFAQRRYPAEKLIAQKHRNAIETVRKWGVAALLFSWLPVVGDGFCFAAGWLRLPFRISLLAIIVGKALRYFAVAILFVP